MKKPLFYLFIWVLTFFIFIDAKAQIKLHDDSHVSLGSLTKDYGIRFSQTDIPTFTHDLILSGAGQLCPILTIHFKNTGLLPTLMIQIAEGTLSL